MSLALAKHPSCCQCRLSKFLHMKPFMLFCALTITVVSLSQNIQDDTSTNGDEQTSMTTLEEDGSDEDENG